MESSFNFSDLQDKNGFDSSGILRNAWTEGSPNKSFQNKRAIESRHALINDAVESIPRIHCCDNSQPARVEPATWFVNPLTLWTINKLPRPRSCPDSGIAKIPKASEHLN